jgi:hypothetical protein
MLSACMVSGHVYPIKGPAAAETPVPVYDAKISGAFNSGTITLKLADGESGSGHWATASTAPAPSGASADNPSAEMPAAWDAVYGHGYYNAHVLGQRLFVEATVTTNRSTVVQVQLYRIRNGSENLGPIYGVARDNKGNIYKVSF